MAKKTVKPGDGFKRQRPELRDTVKELQLLLREAGYQVDNDGLFGKGTEKAVRDFQNNKELAADGIVGSNTWQALYGILNNEDIHDNPGLLEGFRGDLKWVHEREGHAGKAYWPGGASGVTLDPGVDLGHAKPELIEDAYTNLLTPEQMSAVKNVFGIKGDNAKAALQKDPVLQTIRISRNHADLIFQYAARPYWKGIINRFASLPSPDTLSSVQTVMLSLSYNRGARNRDLGVLRQPLEENNWNEVADIIGTMQQDHKLSGIRKRRRMEAELIKAQIS